MGSPACAGAVSPIMGKNLTVFNPYGLADSTSSFVCLSLPRSDAEGL